jgi:hypothetical protein
VGVDLRIDGLRSDEQHCAGISDRKLNESASDTIALNGRFKASISGHPKELKFRG